MTKKKHTYINIGNILLASLLAIIVYFMAGSMILYLKDRFYNILDHSILIQGCYVAMIIIMLLCCMMLLVCGILLWNYDEKP